MRVAFINPHEEPFINLGLAYVISSVEKDHLVKLLDMAFHTKDYPKYVISTIKEFQPDVVGFSVTSFSFHYALKIAFLIRNLYPKVLLVYGGVHPTLLPEETLQNPLVDAICIGEGEDSFREYLQRLQNYQEPKGVAGIWYKDASGNIIKNPLKPFREDLDSIPFPNWDHWDGRGKLFKAWNTPRVATIHLSKYRLKIIMLRFFIRRIFKLFYTGFKLKKLNFIIDLFRYIFALENSRLVPFSNYCFLMGLEQFTLYRYVLEKQKKC